MEITVYHLYTIAVLVVLALSHYVSYRLSKSNWLWHGNFLSFAGGVSVSYVFVELLPKISKSQEVLARSPIGVLPFFEKHVYVVTLIGLVFFYGVAQLNQQSRGLYQSLVPFWVSILSYSLFNFLVGYAICDQYDPEVQPLSFFAIAMTLHFFINDHYLWETHHSAYQLLGRTIVVAALILGWLIGLSIDLPASAVAVIVAFIGGGMIMNVLHNELPNGHKDHSFRAFALGALIYTVILLTQNALH